MPSFIGDFDCKVDEKGRLLFPAALRKQVDSTASDGFVVKKDIYEPCLVLYTQDEWARQNAIIRKGTNPYNREHNRFVREFYRDTAEVSLDASGRLLLPRRLLEMVGIEREVVLAGLDIKVEIWARENYQATQPSADEFANLAQKIMGSATINEQ